MITPLFLTSIVMFIIASVMLASVPREHFYNSLVKRDIMFDGGNNWIIHSPDDNRHIMYIAPSSAYGKLDWNWNKQTRFIATDGRIAVPRIQLGEKFLLSGVGDKRANDEYLRLMDHQNNDYYGGFAAKMLWSSEGKLAGSDRRLKDDIQEVDETESGKVLDLVPKSYVYKSDEGKHKRFGFIAQEVEGVVPELVRDGPDGLKGIAYEDIIPLLLAQVKKMRVEIDELKAKIDK